MPRLPRIVLALVAAGSLASFAVWSARFAAWPWVLNKGEGISLWSAERLLHGLLPYPDPAFPPFALCAYPIGYPALAAGFVAVFGNSLLGLRILSVVAELATACAAAALLARRGPLFPGAAWSAVLLGLLSVHKFHAVARVDLPLLALTVLSVGQIVRFVDGRRTGSLVAAAATAAAAVLVKPTAVVTLLACAGWAAFALRHARRDLVRLALALTAGAAVWAAVTVALQLATGGEYVRQTLELHALKGAWPSAWIWQSFVARYLPVLVAGAFALLLPASPLFKLLACVSTGWAIASTRAAGSDLNYTLEPLTWTTLLVASASTRLLRRAEEAGARARILGAVGAAAVLVAVPPLLEGPVRAGEMSAEAREEGATLSRLMDECRGVTLSEEPFFAVIHGKELLVTDPFGMSVLAGRGRFDERPLLKELDEGRVARVFLGADLQANPAIRDSLRRRYRQIYVTHGKLADTRWIVLEPNPGP